MGVAELAPVLDHKPIEYNPWLDPSTVNTSPGGTLAPRSVGTAPDPVYNPNLAPRASAASAANAVASPSGWDLNRVRAAGAGLRGDGIFDPNAFERGLDSLSPQELDDFIDGANQLSSRAGREVAATAGRESLQNALRVGSQAAGILGTALDVYAVGDAILDPTNNPLDEILDVAGSGLGGALGSAFGPGGTLVGSIAGGYLGRGLGNLLQGDSRGAVVDSESVPFTGGQGTGVAYRVFVKFPHSGNTSVYTTAGWPVRSILGPISAMTSESVGGDYYNYAFGSGIGPVGVAGTWNKEAPYIERVERIDGQPDTGGNPAPTRTRPTTPNYAPRPDGVTDPYSPTLPDVRPDGYRSPQLDPPGDLAPNVEPNIENPTVPDGSPGVDDIPEDKYGPEAPPNGPDKPEEPDKCCPSTIGRLDEVIALLTQEYQGTVDLTECQGEEDIYPWQGQGIAGVIEAVYALQQQAQAVHENTKCGSDPAPLPMLWEIKSGQVPQLAVVWAKKDGGSSRWSMHVPHPKADITADTLLSFPDYTKGSLMATLKLSDNSKVIVNALDKGEADKVMSYLTNDVIEGSYLTDSKLTYTEGAASRVEVEVTAKHLTAYSEEKGAPPLWARSLG